MKPMKINAATEPFKLFNERIYRWAVYENSKRHLQVWKDGQWVDMPKAISDVDIAAITKATWGCKHCGNDVRLGGLYGGCEKCE